MSKRKMQKEEKEVKKNNLIDLVQQLKLKEKEKQIVTMIRPKFSDFKNPDPTDAVKCITMKIKELVGLLIPNDWIKKTWCKTKHIELKIRIKVFRVLFGK